MHYMIHWLHRYVTWICTHIFMPGAKNHWVQHESSLVRTSKLLLCVCFVPVSQLRLLATLWMNQIHSVLCPTALLSSYRLSLWLLLWSQSISYLVFSFPIAFYFSQHYCLFQSTLCSHDWPSVSKLLMDIKTWPSYYTYGYALWMCPDIW